MPRVVNNFPALLPADVICCHGKGLFSRLILWCERWMPDSDTPTPPPDTSHIAPVRDPWTVIEAVGGIRLAPVSEYKYTPVVIYRRRGLLHSQRIAISAIMMTAWNEKYGWGKIALFVLDAIFRTYWFTRHWGVTHFKVCSQLEAWAWQKKFGPMVDNEDWRDVTPQMLRNWCRSHPADWEEVYNSMDTGDPSQESSLAEPQLRNA